MMLTACSSTNAGFDADASALSELWDVWFEPLSAVIWILTALGVGWSPSALIGKLPSNTGFPIWKKILSLSENYNKYLYCYKHIIRCKIKHYSALPM